jgi:hypothetical protein
MARLLRYIHPHISRYAQVDVPCRQTIIRRNRGELFLTVTLTEATDEDILSGGEGPLDNLNQGFGDLN